MSPVIVQVARESAPTVSRADARAPGVEGPPVAVTPNLSYGVRRPGTVTVKYPRVGRQVVEAG